MLARFILGGALACALACLSLLASAVPGSIAAAAHVKLPTLTTIEAPPAPLVLAAPSAPSARQVVEVKVAPVPAADTSIALPVSEWAAAARNVILSVMLAVWAVAKNKLPAPLLWALKVYGEEKLITQARDLAINAIPGASKTGPLTIDVGSQVVAHGTQWVINTVPGLIVHLMGGEDGVRAKIFAALHLEPDASAAALGVATTA